LYVANKIISPNAVGILTQFVITGPDFYKIKTACIDALIVSKCMEFLNNISWVSQFHPFPERLSTA
jgi:hypothetical protein